LQPGVIGVNIDWSRPPNLERLYWRFLESRDTAGFIQQVSQRYTVATLQRLAAQGQRISRRAAVLALGFLGGFESNDVLGHALRDRDRGVRMLAEDGIRSVWLRAGGDVLRQQVLDVIRLIRAQQFAEADVRASEVLEVEPSYAEAWNQRAIARFCLQQYGDSIHDCHEAAILNRFHFGAAAGMGQAYLALDDPQSALECFRWALNINPGLEGVRAEMTHLQRALEEK
jgi:tetratricopeptide (TPR) repeat protein